MQLTLELVARIAVIASALSLMLVPGWPMRG